jgi:hypothetical protein
VKVRRLDHDQLEAVRQAGPSDAIGRLSEREQLLRHVPAIYRTFASVKAERNIFSVQWSCSVGRGGMGRDGV